MSAHGVDEDGDGKFTDDLCEVESNCWSGFSSAKHGAVSGKVERIDGVCDSPVRDERKLQTIATGFRRGERESYCSDVRGPTQFRFDGV